ncbi:peroxiredoxin-like family protein [Flavobacterium fluviatile]|uniref:peroxiredoxin-like family protein n=1 Tax=Flavobacterium fluviatile TaxID=1862387 RepID=UPI0013D6AEA0|nr:peroxiredoxin-like family protein [Flavobacterium fluviatile]
MKLTKGQKAPNFKTTDIWGNTVELLKNENQKTLLTFFRYAECALCNLRISELKARKNEFERKNIKLIAVFESPAESLKKMSKRHQFDFIIIADPGRKLYNLYNVNPSWSKLIKTISIKGIKSVIEASKLGFSPRAKIEGKMHQIPADFLINENGIMEIVHYGNSVVDHISLNEVLI